MRSGVSRSRVAAAATRPTAQAFMHPGWPSTGAAFARWVEGGQDVGPTAEGAQREPAAEHLAEAAQVGLDAGPPLPAADGEAERDHLVDDEERTDLGGHLADAGEVAGVGRDHPRRAHHGLDEDGGQVGPDLPEDGRRGVDVVEREHHRVGERRPTEAFGPGHGPGRSAGPAWSGRVWVLTNTSSWLPW